MENNDSDIIGISRLDENRSGGGGGQSASVDPPVTPTEITIAAIWQNALEGIPIQRQDHFIVLGGDSLTLADVIMEIEKVFGIHFPVDVIANNLTLAGMSAAVDKLAQAARNTASPPASQ